MFICPFLLFFCFCNSTSKIENIQNTLLLTLLFQHLQICTRKNYFSCFHFFFHNKNLYVFFFSFSFSSLLFVHCHSFPSSNCTSAFFLWKASMRQPMVTMALDGCTMLKSFWDGSSWYWLVGHWHGRLGGTLSEQAPVGCPVFALDGGHGGAAERKG